MGLEPFIFYVQRPLETADRMLLLHKFGKVTANQ